MLEDELLGECRMFCVFLQETAEVNNKLLINKTRARFLPRRSRAVAVMFWVISSALLCTYMVFWVVIRVSNKPGLKI